MAKFPCRLFSYVAKMFVMKMLVANVLMAKIPYMYYLPPLPMTKHSTSPGFLYSYLPVGPQTLA